MNRVASSLEIREYTMLALDAGGSNSDIPSACDPVSSYDILGRLRHHLFRP